MTKAEHFERTLEQDCKQKSAKLLALQLQGQRPKTTPGPPALHLPRGPLSKRWSKDQGRSCHQLGHRERGRPQRSYVNSSQMPSTYLQRRAPHTVAGTLRASLLDYY